MLSRLRSRWSEILLLLALFGLGLGLRVINLTQPPLDFHPTRQLRSAIIARGMYYAGATSVDPQRREIAIATWASMERYEPPILEQLVAWGYALTGGERLWLARLFSSLFWVTGGMALYGLVRRMHSPAAALFALAFYLVLPWGVQASRAFQPDPFMVMWILLAVYALYRWSESGMASWRWTAAAGIFAGLAVLVKAYAVFPIAGAAVCLLLYSGFAVQTAAQAVQPRSSAAGIARRFARPQMVLLALLAASIPALYYLNLGERSSSFLSFWVGSFSDLLLDRKFYIHWLGLIRGLMDVVLFFAAMLGIFLYPARGRALAAGMWLGYLGLGAVFPYQIYTHDYYSLMLVPIAAVGLAPYAAVLWREARQQGWLWRGAFSLLLLAIFGYYAWVARSQIAVTNYSNEPYPWQQMGASLPTDGDIIGLTHDYGNRLKYYGWRSVHRLWPNQAEMNLSQAAGGQRYEDFEPFFRQETAGMEYFLVTLFGDLEAQPALKSYLYAHYPIAQSGDGYLLFDLRQPK